MVRGFQKGKGRYATIQHLDKDATARRHTVDEKTSTRAHHIHNVKRDGTAKVRVVVNGKRQHESTFSDTTSPVIPQFQFRTFLAHTALRQYHMVQMDLTMKP